jgi:sugar-specific transcriptional regulator TrmB
MHIQTILKNFGLNEKEIAVYLALVSLGPSPVRAIALKAKVNRGTTYDILKSLLKNGLVSYFNKESHQYFSPESPEKLISALEQKQSELEEVKKQVKQSLPELKTLFEKEGGKPAVKLYEGIKGIRSILEDVLDTLALAKDKQYYVYSSSTVRKNVYQAMPDFSKKRIKKKIHVRTIALGGGGQVIGLDERKWMEAPERDLKATYEIIYLGKVVHISLDNSENPVGVLIQNQEIYETQKMIFEFTWNKL